MSWHKPKTHIDLIIGNRFFGGESDQEAASKKQYEQISRFNPTVQNRFNNLNLPFSPAGMLPAFNRATEAGVRDIGKQTGSNVKRAQKSTAAGLQSRGYGGSILEDAIAKARSSESEKGTNAIRSLLTSRMAQIPGIMNQANRTQLALTQGAQGADFQNIANMFNKFGAQGAAIGGLSDDTWFDDLLAVGNTAGQFIPLI